MFFFFFVFFFQAEDGIRDRDVTGVQTCALPIFETIGGDLTIKIEDNTEDGEGIYSEDVDDPNQS